MRIQKALAHLGIGSRRHCERLVAEGSVLLDGETVQIGQSVSEEELLRVVVNGEPVGEMPEKHYFLLHKPKDHVTTVSDPQGRKTVMDLLPFDSRQGPKRVYPVGRLDRQTTGVLLFTNDGALANKLLHPSSGVEKEYVARVRGRITRDALTQLRQGPELDDGPTQPPKEVAVRGQVVRLVIKEGRKRQVRRMLKTVGLYCQALERLRFGNLSCRGLNAGEYRILTAEEVESLKRLCGDTA